MRDIYSRANAVLVWLGEEKDNSDLAMDRIEEWGDRVLQDTEDLFDAQIWHALGGFAKRSWWRRLLGLQEVVVATDVTVMCGYRSIPRDYLLFYSALCNAMQRRPSAVLKNRECSALVN
jgi:hypothetical protein